VVDWTVAAAATVGRVRRRSLTALAIAAALVAGCTGGNDVAGTPPATDRCTAVEFPTMQFGSHLIGDAAPPVPYSSTPPTSGWHSSGAPPTGVFTDPLSEPAQVLALEAGGVVVTHAGLPEAEFEALVDAAEAFPDTVVVTPYADIPAGTVVYASWGALQRCESFDAQAFERYVAAYGDNITLFEEDSAAQPP
jgi:hypothetical protein